MIPPTLSSLPRDEPPPDRADLAAELAALLRAGCSICFSPRLSALGVVYVDLVIAMPGERRVFHRFHVVYELAALPVLLRRVRELFLSVPPHLGDEVQNLV